MVEDLYIRWIRFIIVEESFWIKICSICWSKQVLRENNSLIEKNKPVEIGWIITKKNLSRV